MPDDLALAIAALPPAYAALTIVQTADREGLDVIKVAEVHFALGQRLGLDRLLTRIIELPRDDRWQTMARAALRDDLHAVHAELTAQVLAADGAETRTARDLVTGWEKAQRRGSPSRSGCCARSPAAAPTWPGPRSACAGCGRCCRLDVSSRASGRRCRRRRSRAMSETRFSVSRRTTTSSDQSAGRER